MKKFNCKSREIQERLIVENEFAFCFLSFMPIVPGHCLICPIRVVETTDDLSLEELKSIMQLKSSICSALSKTFGAEGFNFAWNEGEIAGQSVPHFHLHVVPRKEGDTGILEYEPRKFLYRPGSRAITPKEELQQIATLIKNHL